MAHKCSGSHLPSPKHLKWPWTPLVKQRCWSSVGTQTLTCGHIHLWSFGDKFHPLEDMQKNAMTSRKCICILGSRSVFLTCPTKLTLRLEATLCNPSLPEPCCLPLTFHDWFQSSPVTGPGLCILLFSFITSLIYAYSHTPRKKTFSSTVGLDHRLLQFRLLRHCLRKFGGRSKSEICSSSSTRTFSIERWTGNLTVTRQLHAFCKHEATFSTECYLALQLLQNTLCCRSSSYLHSKDTGCQTLQLLTRWAEVKNAWSELTLVWVIWLTQRNITRPSSGKKKVLGEEPGALQQAYHTGFTENWFSSCAVVCNACPWNLKTRIFNNIIFSAARRTGSAISLPGLFAGLRYVPKSC